MEAYITLLGRSTWALLNTYYAAVDGGYEPDLVRVFAEESYENRSGEVEEGLEIISEGYGFSPDIETRVVDDVDFVKAGKKIRGTLRALMEEGKEVSIDVTPGRKALVTGALLSAFDLSTKNSLNVDRILYLAIETTEEAAKPYYMIPLEIQELTDFIENMRSSGGPSSGARAGG